MEKIWVAIINLVKDIIVAIIKSIKKEKGNGLQEVLQKYEVLEEDSGGPFIPNPKEIGELDISDSEYLVRVGTYLASDRPVAEIKIADKEAE